MKTSMFKRVLTIALIFGIIAGAGLFTAESAMAQAPSGGTPAADAANWVVAITYQNTGTDATGVSVLFYPEGSDSPTEFNPRDGKGDLAAGAADSFYIGNVNLPNGFRGNAVMSANVSMAATAVQFSQDTYSYAGGQQPYKMRLLSNAFSADDVSNQYLVATALKNKFSRTTTFSVQNTSADAIEATFKFYDADNNGNLASTKTFVIPAFSSKWMDMAVDADTGLSAPVFNGSAIITAVKQGTNTASEVVASAGEYYTNRPVATAYEGVPLSAAAKKIYMATALCQRFGLDTYYAVQNASLTDDATIVVTYKNLDGSTKTTDGPYDIGPGQKKSITTCAPSVAASGGMAGFTGAAVIDVTSGNADIVAIGKAQYSQDGGNPGTADVLTAFLGQANGYSKLAMPFVRWASDANFNSPSNSGGKQRTFIAVQNLENSQIKVNAHYNDKNGATVKTDVLTIEANSKANTDANSAGALGQNGMNAGEFGYYTDNSFGGGVILEAHPDNPSAKFIAISRVQNPGAGEDYNGIPVQ